MPPQSKKSVRYLIRRIRSETAGFYPRLSLAQLLVAPFPRFVASGWRRFVYKHVAGFDIGKDTVFWGTAVFTGWKQIQDNLEIGDACWINAKCIFDLRDKITIGDRVSMGHEVLLMTSTHELQRGPHVRRAGRPKSATITIGDYAWIGSRAIIQPGVTIGEGAVIHAGSVVTRDIPANALAGGVPAQVLKQLDGEPETRAAVGQLDPHAVPI